MLFPFVIDEVKSRNGWGWYHIGLRLYGLCCLQTPRVVFRLAESSRLEYFYAYPPRTIIGG